MFTVFVVAVIAKIALYGKFQSSSVCSQCGEIRQTTEWHIPTTDIIIFTHSSEHSSPVGAVVNSSGIVLKHEHHWLFCQGGGNGIFCAVGGGLHILPAAESPQVADIISASQRFGNLKLRDRIVSAVFDPNTSEAIHLLCLMAPTNGFQNASAFHAWFDEQTQFFDEQLASQLKAVASTPVSGP